MIYNVIFTVYTLIAVCILSFTFANKNKIKTVRTKVYVALIISCFVFGLFEVLNIFVYATLTQNRIVTQILWSLKIIGMFYYIYFFFVYYSVVTKGYKYEKFLDELFKVPKYLIVLIVITIITLLYLIFNKCDTLDLNNLVFVRGAFGYIMLILCVGVVSLGLILGYKKRKENINIFRSLLLFFVLFLISLPLQIKFVYISLMPFICGFICYIVYYNLENPDLKLLDEVGKLKDDIERSNNTKTDFLFNLSYDLINPINTIVSLSDSIISNQNLDEKVIIEDISSIKLAGNTLLDSIDNIFEMSNDSGNSIKEYSLYELLNRVKSISETRIGAKNVKFELNIDNNLSSKYIGDINKIQKVLLNILGNAVKFTDVGKIIFSVNFSIQKDFHVLHFKILDTGSGIKEEEKSFIFSDSDADKTGIGLAISKKYIEEMGGTIRFESVYGGGTTFYVDLPQKVSGNRVIGDEIVDDVKSNVIEYTDLSNYKVLIVDDDNLDIKVTKRLLEKYNLQIEVCESTVEFIDKIKCDEEYDLVFLDHKMSEFDGVETVKLLRKLDGYVLPKITCLTANASNGSREYYKSVGFDDYISKPIDIYELDKILKKFLK